MMRDEEQELPFTALERERYFEDYITGAVHTLGEAVVDGEEMIAFAKRFDPQDIHIDEAKANTGPFNGLIASGWFTGSLVMKLYATRYLSNVSSFTFPYITWGWIYSIEERVLKLSSLKI